MTARALITVDGAECSYGSIPALEGVSLSISTHEMCGVIGPNGSGKTTLLRTMDGVLSPKRGGVMLAGRPLNAMSRREVAAMVGVVPQRASAAFGFTAYEIVSMGRSPHLAALARETERDDEIVSAAMDQTGVRDLARRPIDSLSGGEFQRVLIARALAQEPRVLLLDEPTAHLDLRYQSEIMDLLSTLTRSGLTVVAALHDINLAAAYCTRLILLASGLIAAMGNPDAVLEASTLERVYGVPVIVTQHPSSGRPHVFTAATEPAARRQ